MWAFALAALMDQLLVGMKVVMLAVLKVALMVVQLVYDSVGLLVF